jgi:predicted nucleic acid-binding protein
VVVAALSSGGATGRWAESVLAGEPLAAPHVLPVEAASILHRAERAGEISADAASLAYADLGRLRVEYFPYAPFAERIWELCAALPGSHLQQAELLQRLRPGIADAQTSRKRVELQMDQLQQESTKHEDQARKALRSGREDLAREALQRKSSLQTQLNDLQTQYAALQDQEEKLTIASQTLQAKIDAVRLAETEATRPWPGAAPQADAANLSCYDAWYVALAEFLGVKLATLNARLARAPGPCCGFWLPPAESAPGP